MPWFASPCPAGSARSTPPWPARSCSTKSSASAVDPYSLPSLAACPPPRSIKWFVSVKAIDVENLSRRFGKIEAVKEISFAIEEGEIFGFLGPNGAGKTTTINMLCTLLRPGGGSARVNGFDIVRQRSDVRRSIGLVFQQSTLDEQLSAEQNLRFHGYAYGVPAALREQRIHDLLTMVELY